MLVNTFLHIPGIGIKTEKRLWASGVHTWEDFTQNCPIRLSPYRLDTITRYIQELRQIEYNNPGYFSNLLPTGFHWRLFPQFRNATVYLDIDSFYVSDNYGTGNRTVCVVYIDFNSTHYLNINQILVKQRLVAIKDVENDFNPNVWAYYTAKPIELKESETPMKLKQPEIPTDALMNLMGSFDLDVEVVQWNEYPYTHP